MSHYVCSFADCAFSGRTWPLSTARRFALVGLNSHSHARSHKVLADLIGADGRPLTPPIPMRDRDDGTEHLYVSTDYQHPTITYHYPPIIIERGQHLEWSCLYDNGIERPVKLGCEEAAGIPSGIPPFEAFKAGRGMRGGFVRGCRSDADCAGYGTGRCMPANLVYGNTADDTMCGFTVAYYECPEEGPCIP
jgi:hypothetical protein